MAEEPRGRGRRAARVSHNKGGGHAAPGMGRVAARAARNIQHAPGFVARQAAAAGSWESAASVLIEEDDETDMTHPLYQGMKFPEYEYREFPKFVGGKIANNEEEEKLLLEGMPLVRTEEERARMIAVCEVKDIQHDKRWGVERLRKAIIDAGEDPKFDPSK